MSSLSKDARWLLGQILDSRESKGMDLEAARAWCAHPKHPDRAGILQEFLDRGAVFYDEHGKLWLTKGGERLAQGGAA